MRDLRRIAGRYAQALAEAVPDDQELARIHEGLAALARIYRASRELRRVLTNPVIPSDSKARLVDTLAERAAMPERGRRLLRILAAHERLLLLPELAEAVSRLVDRRRGVRAAEIVSAAPLPEDLRERLGRALEEASGGRVRITERIDPDLMGGIVAKVGATVYDGSVRSRLERLRSRLAGQAAARTIH